MSRQAAESFMRALQEIEVSGDVGPLVELFTDNAELENPARSAARQGREGIRQFWREYLSAFDHIRSEFTRVNVGDRFAALEWRSDGALPTGTPLSYRGVSLIEFDDHQKVQRFCTYYDSATFLPEGSKGAEAVASH